MKKLFAGVLLVFLLSFLIFGIIFRTEIRQLYHVIRLFEEDRIVYNFTNIDKIFPVVTLERSSPVRPLPSSPKTLPTSFTFLGDTYNLEEWLQSSSTTSFLVVSEDSLVHEAYFQDTTESDKRISWSVAKSFLSVLFGFAIDEGLIPDLDVPVTDFVPELSGTGYEGVTIRNVLQMSSGVYFNEDYGDFYSDINRFGRAIAFGTSFDSFATSLTSDPNLEPGTVLHYVSIDTHVIGMVLRAATGRTIKELFEEHLWSAAGFEEDAYFLADGLDEPMVLGGLNMIARDYARFGMLIRDYGRFDDQQVVPEWWLLDSITPDAPHLVPAENLETFLDFGYGYQWWIPSLQPHGEEEILAIGIYGQYIYINRKHNLVITKSSADINFGDQNSLSYVKAVHAFRAIANHLSESTTSY